MNRLVRPAGQSRWISRNIREQSAMASCFVYVIYTVTVVATVTAASLVLMVYNGHSNSKKNHN